MNLEAKLRSYISEKRLTHSRGTMETAVRLAEYYGSDAEKARLAGLLHDVARDMPLSRLEMALGRGVEGIGVPFRTVSLLHAPAGSIVARSDFGVEEPDVLRSIEVHTTGHPSMTLLNKIIFIADFIEPGRSFRGVQTARRLAFRSLDRTVAYILGFTLRSLLMRNLPILEVTCRAYNAYSVRVKNG